MTSQEKLQVTAVIPCKNEAVSLARILPRVLKTCQQVIVVNGKSTDNSAQVANEAGAQIVEDPGIGKGAALQLAIPHIQYPVTVFMDADGSHSPEDIHRILEPIFNDQQDHVSGSRLLGGSSELHGGFDEFLRLSGSAFITTCINWRYHVRLSDTQNGFRAIRTSVLKQLDLHERSTTIEQEMIAETLRRGFRMGEIATHEHARLHGKSHISIARDWWKYVLSLLKILCARSQKA